MTQPCEPWIRQLLASEIDWLGFNPQRMPVPRLAHRREELLRTRACLENLLAPGKPSMLAAQLGRMALHFHETLPKVTVEGKAELFADYLQALGHFPHDIFKAACLEYQLGGRFWPKVSELKALMDGPFHARKWDWQRINILCAAVEQSERNLPPKPRRLSGEELARLCLPFSNNAQAESDAYRLPKRRTDPFTVEGAHDLPFSPSQLAAMAKSNPPEVE